MGMVKVDDVICVLKNDKDLLNNWEQFLTNMKIKSIGETEKSDLKANFEQTRDVAQLMGKIVTQWTLDNGNGATVKNLGGVLKASGLSSLKFLFLLLLNFTNEDKLEITFQPATVITIKSDTINKPGGVETLLQIISWTSGGGKEECQLFLPELLHLLSNIGSRPVAIISINGKKSLSNYILTDGIIKYLKFGRRADTTGFENGFSSNPVDFEAGSRIRIWNEPLYIHNNGKETGVIVMEQDGTNPITTALSLLLSSVSIFLQSNDNAEQAIQWFSNFLSANEPKVYSKKLYQVLIILFNKNEKFSQQRSENEIRQLKTMLLNESSKQQFPAALDKYFDVVNCDIVGIPDGNLPNISSICHTSLLNFLEKQFSPEKLENSVKQVCGKLLTGNSLKDFVCLWAQIVTTSKEKLRPKTILFDTEKLFATNLTSELLAKYRTLMGEILISSPDLTGEKFEAFHSETVTELQNEIIKTAVPKSIKDDCGNKFKMHTEALKGNLSKEIYSKPTQQKTDTGIVSNIQYDENKELGRGSRETIVYQGTFGDRPVAVKRLNRVQFDIDNAEKEVKILIGCDNHQNVIQFFHGEERGDCYLIALELCDCTLEEWVKKKQNNVLDAKDILRQTTDGLAHLHLQKQPIIHGDIKPQNILLSNSQSTTQVCVKISDFGISKILAEQRSSATLTSGSGSEGWTAPEILNDVVNESPTGKPKIDWKSDIFSLGCVFYYVLSKGAHPFGDKIRRQGNILDGKLQLNVDLLKTNGAGEAECLIRLMLSKKKGDRPPASAIIKHYLLWSPSKISSFLVCTNKCWEAKKIPECSDVKNYLDKWKRLVFNQQDEWGAQLDRPFLEHLKKLYEDSKKNIHKQNFSRVDDMIRLIRNTEMHQTEGKLPQHLLDLLELPIKYVVEYFTNKFPFLMPVTWLAFQNLKNVPAFKLEEYYPVDYEFGLEIGKQLGKP